MNNFVTRVITATIFGALCLAGIYFNGAIHLLFLLFSILALKEFYGLIFVDKKPNSLALAYITGIVFFILNTLVLYASLPIKYLSLAIVPLLLLFINELYQLEEFPFNTLAKKILGIVYVIVPFSLFCALGYLTNNGYHYEFPLGFILFLWASDSGGYLLGITIGKHRLFERVSPKKSWEGLAGSILLSLCTAYFFARFFPETPANIWYTMAILVVIFGTLGDLVESLFKRSINIKDSGSILPGHGGVLDRFDGLFMAAPIVYTYLLLFL